MATKLTLATVALLVIWNALAPALYIGVAQKICLGALIGIGILQGIRNVCFATPRDSDGKTELFEIGKNPFCIEAKSAASY